MRTALFAVAYFVLVVTARYIGVDGAHGATVPLTAASAGAALVWLASARTRRELQVDTAAYVVTLWLGLGASSLLGLQANPVGQYALAVLAPLQSLVTLYVLRRWAPYLWGVGGRSSIRTPRDFGIVLGSIVIGVVAFAVVRTLAGELLAPQETLSLAVGRATRSLSAMTTIGLLGLLIGGQVSERRDRQLPLTNAPTVGDAVHMGIAVAGGLVIFLVGFTDNPEAPTTFVLTLTVVWVAIRFSPVVTTTFSLLVGITGVLLTINDIGPIAEIPDLVRRALVAQAFVVVLTVIGAVISLSRRQVLDGLAELQRSEAANARRAAELDQVMANLIDGVAIIEEGGRILHANHALRTAFGTQEATDVDRVRPDSEVPEEERLIRGSDGRVLSDEVSPLTRALAGEAVPPEEWRTPNPVGGLHWVTIAGVPLPPEDDGPARAMLVLRDITSEKAHQQQLETRAAELNMVIDNLNDGLAIVEEGGTYTQANDALRTIFYGRPDIIEAEGDIQGPATYHLFHPDGRPLEDHEFPYARALAGLPVRDEEQHLRRPDAPTQILNVSAFPLPDEPGMKRRAVVVVRDITLERSYQDGLASFAGTVAHDLNNPLSVIDGWAEAIQEDLAESSDPGARAAVSMVDHIRGGVDQMRGFITDLLAHAVARDQTLRCELVSLRNMVGHIASQRDQPDLPQGGLAIGEVPDVWADKLLVRQVLDNLIGNATKYVAPGVVPVIEVSARRLDDSWVEVCVSDNGIGIDPAQRERVFDSFHRASKGTYAGTGLGLAICKRIVERHGGQIRVDANPAGGCSFSFTLPASAAAFAAATRG
jgi:PAS domain S-box-containing protein